MKNIAVIPVNDSPSLEDIEDQDGCELAIISVTAQASDPDLPEDTLVFSLIAPPGASGAQINASTGEFTWIPDETQGPDEYEFTVRVTDAGDPALWAEKNFEVQVCEVNAQPALTPIPDIIIDEETKAEFLAEVDDPDDPANAIVLSLVGAPDAASFDPASGAFEWLTTEEDGPGIYTFTLTATDDGVPVLEDSQIITVEVEEVNAKPVFAAVSDQVIQEGEAISLTVTAEDSDIPANSLTYDLTKGPDGAEVNASTGEFTWQAGESDGGEKYEVIVHVVDNGVEPEEDYITFYLDVVEVNSAPEISLSEDEITVAEENLVSVTADATDSDLPVNTLVFSLDAGAPDGAGIDPATGEFTWTPDESQSRSEPYSIVIRVTDNGSPVKSAEATLTVWVTEGNQPPTLNAIGSKVVMVNQVVTFTAQGSDPDLPTPTLTFAIGANNTPGAAIDPDTGVFTWLPTAAGTYSVEIIISDGFLFDSETIEITVNLYRVLLPIVIRD